MFDQKPSDTVHREEGKGVNCKDGYITFFLFFFHLVLLHGRRRAAKRGMVHWGFIVLFQGHKAYIISFTRHQTLSIVLHHYSPHLSLSLCSVFLSVFLHGAAYKEGWALNREDGTGHVEEAEETRTKGKNTCMLCMKRKRIWVLFFFFFMSTYNKMLMSVVVFYFPFPSLVIDG